MKIQFPNWPRFAGYQKGLTLVELMVTLVISLLIVIAASSFFLGSGKTRDAQEAASTLQDNARYATDLITKNIQQAGYQNYIWSAAGGSFLREIYPPIDGEPDIRGYNNSATGSSTDNGSHNRSTGRVNNSDTLILRFQGSGSGTADGSMIDCRGEPQAATTGTNDRAYSIFEVSRPSATAEPELSCKSGTWSGGTLTFQSEVIVRGVESLQVMYGIDTTTDTFVDQWLTAQEVDALATPAAAKDKWALVRTVRVGMVLRSPMAVTAPSSATSTLSPLGVNFTPNAARERLALSSTDGRLRRVVTFTVNVRNQL